MALESRIRSAESGGNRFARNPRSTAYGPDQFIAPTWLTLIQRYRPDLAQGRSREELLELRSDEGISQEMTRHYADENSGYLKQRGLEPTDENLYLAHFAGPAGAAKLLTNPTGRARDILSPQAIEANPFLADWSGQQVIDWAGRKIGGPTAAQEGAWKPVAAPWAEARPNSTPAATAAPKQENDALIPFLMELFGGSAAAGAGAGAAGAGLGESLAGLFKGGDLAGLFGEASGKSTGGLLNPLFGASMSPDGATGGDSYGSAPTAPNAMAPMGAMARQPIDMRGLQKLMAARPQLGARGVLGA